MLDGKTALITGAGGAIGRAAASAFAREGASLVLSDVSLQAAEDVAHGIHREGGSAISVQADISDRASVRSMIAYAMGHFLRIDCAFNNAGINLSLDAEWELDAFDQSIQVNAFGTMYCLTEEILTMKKTGGGTIVNNASVMGIVGSSRQPGYAASKHAVIGLTRTAALRWANDGIRVNAICPGPVSTPMTEASMAISPEIRARILSMSPMGRLAEPDEIAQAALWLCSPRSSFINGVALPIDGGFTAG